MGAIQIRPSETRAVPARDAAGRVGPREGDHRGDDQDNATGGLLVGEVLEGAYDLLYGPPFHLSHVARCTRRSNTSTTEVYSPDLLEGQTSTRSYAWC
jgi:hypothetical protein